MRPPHAPASLLVSIVALAACAAGPRPPPAPEAPPPAPVPGVPDRDLGLSHSSVFDVPVPAQYTDEAASPGEKPLPPRLSVEIPPTIPHIVSDFLPITRERNGCADCHQVSGPKKAGEPTPIPPSHFVDLRRLATQPGPQLAGARWVCVMCHGGRTDAKPLVTSDYRP